MISSVCVSHVLGGGGGLAYACMYITCTCAFCNFE